MASISDGGAKHQALSIVACSQGVQVKTWFLLNLLAFMYYTFSRFLFLQFKSLACP